MMLMAVCIVLLIAIGLIGLAAAHNRANSDRANRRDGGGGGDAIADGGSHGGADCASDGGDGGGCD